MVFKCSVCKKKFDTVLSLREHHRAVHPKVRFGAPRKERLTKRFFLVLMIVAIIATASFVGYLIYVQASQTTTHSGLLGSPISPSMYQDLLGVNDSTLSSIGS